MAEPSGADFTLGDLGERRLISEVLLPVVDGGGDDCAAIGPISGTLLVSTDPVPEPAAHMLGGDPDAFWKGWLLVTINASDLAASGACPLGFLAALEAPVELPVREFRRFIDGIRAACLAQGLNYVGGNVREGLRLTGTGTSLGVCRDWAPVKRSGAQASDMVVSVGSGGLFWRDALSALRGEGGGIDRGTSPLFSPRSQVHVMWRLAQAGLLNSSMDNSDGFLPTLTEIARSSFVNVEIDLPALAVPGSSVLDVEPARLWMGWGDWNVLATVSPEKLEAASAICAANGSELVPIGRCRAGAGEVFLKNGRVTTPAPRLDSERFAADSWFKVGIRAYVDSLLKMPLPS